MNISTEMTTSLQKSPNDEEKKVEEQEAAFASRKIILLWT